MTLAEFYENLKVSMDTLRAHKVRTGLTLLGMVIGVTSVISVAAIIDGLNRYIGQKVESFGSNTWFISRFPAGTDPSRMPDRLRMRRYFDYDDGRRLREMVRHVENINVVVTRAAFMGDSNDVRAGSERVDQVIVRGVETPYFRAIPLFTVEYGREVTEEEEKRSAPVCLLGGAVAESLFPSVDPIGKNVQVNGQSCDVIGVFARDAGIFGMPSVDQFVVMPITSFRKHNPQVKEKAIIFTVPPGPGAEAAIEELTDAYRRIRRVPSGKENDFEIMSSDFLSKLWNQLTGAIVLLTGVISSIGLVVGGIGVMNIMLISVTERTKEIGVRKAIGARASDIRVQFLLEALLLTILGGIIGITLGAFVAWAVRTAAPSIPASLSLFWVIAGVAMSALTGVFFGYYPADRAARLDPIVCLRYE
jgi:putative ABC transport system permease protein